MKVIVNQEKQLHHCPLVVMVGQQTDTQVDTPATCYHIILKNERQHAYYFTVILHFRISQFLKSEQNRTNDLT